MVWPPCFFLGGGGGGGMRGGRFVFSREKGDDRRCGRAREKQRLERGRALLSGLSGRGSRVASGHPRAVVGRRRPPRTVSTRAAAAAAAARVEAAGERRSAPAPHLSDDGARGHVADEQLADHLRGGEGGGASGGVGGGWISNEAEQGGKGGKGERKPDLLSLAQNERTCCPPDGTSSAAVEAGPPAPADGASSPAASASASS
jgi:hypothetical protein